MKLTQIDGIPALQDITEGFHILSDRKYKSMVKELEKYKSMANGNIQTYVSEAFHHSWSELEYDTENDPS